MTDEPGTGLVGCNPTVGAADDSAGGQGLDYADGFFHCGLYLGQIRWTDGVAISVICQRSG